MTTLPSTDYCIMQMHARHGWFWGHYAVYRNRELINVTWTARGARRLLTRTKRKDVHPRPPTSPDTLIYKECIPHFIYDITH
jgi:hypothetical protein